MFKTSVRIEYFFQDYKRFPWEIMDLTVPKAGPLYSYICLALAPYLPESHRRFFKGSPSLRELKRFAEENEGVAKAIHDYSLKEESVKMDTARAVLEFLKRVPEFRDEFQRRMNSLYHQDLIQIPREAEPLGE